MPQEYQLPDRVYKYPFELIMLAYERRFPTCSMIPAFLGSETIHEYKSKDGAVHVIERRCKIDVEAPYLLKKVCGADHVFFIQKNSLNLRNRTLNIVATNETFSSRVKIKEECAYKPHPDNEEWTIFTQRATLNIISFFGIEAQVEKLGIKAYHKNIKKGKEIIIYYVNELESEGVVTAPRWSQPDNIDSDSDSDDSFASADDDTRMDDLTRAEFLDLPYCLGVSTNDYKLDSDYITTHLGELNPMEECSIIQLAKRMKQTFDKIPDERVLLRFLRARNFDIEKTREMLIKSMAWRKQYNIDAHLDIWTPPPIIEKYLPGAWHRSDKDGRPVYILRLGHLDIKGMLRAVGEDALLRYALYICEQGIQKTNATAQIRYLSSWTLLIDLEGLNLRHLWAPARIAMRRFTEVMEQNYPETLGVVLIVQAPRLFPLAWTLVKSFINENTRRKCLVYGGNDYLEDDGIHSYIHREDIPDFLGGPSPCNIECNGLVPREDYTRSTEEVLAKEAGLQSLYKNCTIKKGEIHEVQVEADVDGVITWDFDCVLGELQFTVSQRIFAQPQCNSSLAGLVEMAGITYSTTPSPTDSYTDNIVEESTVCSYLEGDSVQGSFYVSKPGTYILSWGNVTPAASICSKSTFLYSIETIEPKDYAGSVSSLTSSFSNLSSAGSSWNTSSVASWNSMVSR
ncbi:SEC14-like protein 1 isoform X3 [Bolinopsis microptera]|uniref:SEC14-like protein 1 isoform X3 n=1 Tax=Bolinopsis microptera TaxID=2820187 RepID=UPI00307ACE09